MLGYRVQNKVSVAAKSRGKRFEWEKVSKVFVQHYSYFPPTAFKRQESLRDQLEETELAL